MRLLDDVAKTKQSFASNWHRFKVHSSRNVSTRHTYLIILTCCFISGLCDGASIAAYSVFLSMQTGNTMFFAAGAANLPPGQPYNWARALISVVSFIVGAAFYAYTGRKLGEKKRWYLCASFMTQSILMIIASALIQSGAVPNRVTYEGGTDFQRRARFLERIPIALMSFQFSAQLIHATVLGSAEIPSVVLTSVYINLVKDVNFFQWRNKGRDLKLADVVLTILGAIAGPWLVRSRTGIAGAFWIGAGLKFVLAIMWLFWREERITITEQPQTAKQESIQKTSITTSEQNESRPRIHPSDQH